MSLFNLCVPDFKDHEDAGPWRSYDLESSGDTLDELLENAVYWQIDQDGGCLGDVPADDSTAQEYIEAWFHRQVLTMVEDEYGGGPKGAA